MGSSCSLPTLPVPISRSLWCAFLLLDLGDGVLDLQLVRELSERGEHGYAALMCIATLISVAAGVLFGRYAHAVAKAKAAAAPSGSVAWEAAAASMVLAFGELLSFGVEDSTTLYVLANVEGLYEGAGKSGFSADLNLLTTALSSLAVLALLVLSAGKLVQISVRRDKFGAAASVTVPTLLLAALVAYFTAVAVALFTHANATPLAPDTLDPLRNDDRVSPHPHPPAPPCRAHPAPRGLCVWRRGDAL